MIEEYIQGESLETFVSHQKSISEELIVKLGIQLCDIFTYLHHLSPYPILYQDLKPEHIILCGDQVKLLDFGIASFLPVSEKISNFTAQAATAAPEILRGQPVTPGCRHLQSRQGFNGAFGRHVLPLFQTASVHLRAGLRRRSGRPLSGGL